MCYSYDPLGSSQETQVFDFQVNMVAKLKFKGIYRKAPPGVEPVVLFDPTREASPSPDTDRGGSCSPKTLGWPMPTLIPQTPVLWRSPPPHSLCDPISAERPQHSRPWLKTSLPPWRVLPLLVAVFCSPVWVLVHSAAVRPLHGIPTVQAEWQQGTILREGLLLASGPGSPTC